MKANDYLLTEKYVQQCARECIMKTDIDLFSDHRILITSLFTPMTRKTCRGPTWKVRPEPLNLKSLQNGETKRVFLKAVKDRLRNYNLESQSPTEILMNITKILNSPPLVNQNCCKEIWKNDQEFNRHLSQHEHVQKMMQSPKPWRRQ